MSQCGVFNSTTPLRMFMERLDCSTLEQLRGALLEFVSERDWEQFHDPKSLAASVSIESGELLECFQWDNPTSKQVQLDDDRLEHIGEEMSDILLYLLRLEHVLGIDLLAAAEKKLQSNREKYPLDEFKGSSRKYDSSKPK